MKDLFIILFCLFAVSIVILFIPWLTMCLWNWLMPEIFGLKQISFMQAFGLVVLFNIFSGLKVSK